MHVYGVVVPIQLGVLDVMGADKKTLAIVVGCVATGQPWDLSPFLGEVTLYVRRGGVLGQSTDGGIRRRRAK